MMAEGIHSLVDTTNGLLLLYGIKRSKREPNAAHPFGHGKEVYFWAFIVAILIFGLGGGFAIYEGIHHVQHPGEIKDPLWNYVVLGIGIVLEGTAFTVAMRVFRKTRRGYGLIKSIRRSKDAATFAVIIEDSAALVGLILAMIGITITQVTGLAYVDGITSIVIGSLLCMVAVFLANEARGLLVGESMKPEELAKVKKLLDEHPQINRSTEPKTMHFGPQEILMAMDVDFKHALGTRDLELLIVDLENSIREINPHHR